MGQYLYRHSLLNAYQQKFHNYDYQDGVPMGGFVEGSATITPDGTIYFGSITWSLLFQSANN